MPKELQVRVTLKEAEQENMLMQKVCMALKWAPTLEYAELMYARKQGKMS